MRRELEGDMVFDASVLVEVIFSTVGGRLVRRMLVDEVLFGYVTELAVSELRYVVCRMLGRDEAWRRVDKLLASGYFRVEEISPIVTLASEYKCERAISLPDCFSIALGEYLSMPVLFARREKELVREIERKPFDVDILFLEDYVRKHGESA